jgi:GH43 family beta-xylosidase
MLQRFTLHNARCILRDTAPIMTIYLKLPIRSVLVKRNCLILVAIILSSLSAGAFPLDAPLNPVLTGADPHVVVVGDMVWMYVTGYKEPTLLYGYSSTDLQHWERHGPILKAEDIPWFYDDGEKDRRLWAPCIIEKEGRWLLYFSVGPQRSTAPSRIGVAVGTNPAGPFKAMDAPLLTGGAGFEAIDPMVFVDASTGVAYLYAGGSAGAVLRIYELSGDWTALGREIKVETPPHFTEAPYMHERHGRYYLSYSSGDFRTAGYAVHYALADSPTGPWHYQGIVLESSKEHKGPGHHSILHDQARDQDFIVYHRWNHQKAAESYHAARQIAIDRLSYGEEGLLESVEMTAGNIHFAMMPTALPPGVVIQHAPQASGRYIGSPSLTVLSDGVYLAAHDYFGPESKEHECATAAVYRSDDRGEHWRQLTELQCLFWPKLFHHNGAVYIMGVEKHHGRIVIRRSLDHGETWTEPVDGETGLLTEEGQFHTAPVPVVEHQGRLWRAFEDASNGTKWGYRYSAGMLSIAVDADLLRAENWTFSNFLNGDEAWLDGEFGGWLEGNAVVAPDGSIVNVLRVDTPDFPEKGATVHVSSDGKVASFDGDTGFYEFPGAAKKFTIRPDESTGTYWMLATVVPEKFQKPTRPSGIRNTLALCASSDLRHWEERAILLHHPDTEAHGFQYVDWQFDGDDIIAVCRTAYDDGIGGARNNHDANFLTFHRIENFRELYNIPEELR